MFSLEPADEGTWRWAACMVAKNHYLHTVPDPRTTPFCYVLLVAEERAGCLWFGRPESTACFQGELTYGSLAHVQRGRARYDRWEILNLSRLWLSPDVQAGGRLYLPSHLPGFVDRKGVFRSCLASEAVREALGRIGFDYLMQRPPCFVEEPYAVRAVLSYCDRRLHKGVVYRTAGFSLSRVNSEGVETWWTPAVAPLTASQDEKVRRGAAANPRSAKVRAKRFAKEPDLWE